MPRQTKISLAIIIIIVAVFTIIGFFATKKTTTPDTALAPEQTKPAKIKVVATFLPMYIFTKNIAMDLAEVDNLLPSDVSPHEYSFTPSDLLKISRADVVVKNGAGIDDWLDNMIRSAGNSDLTVIDASKGINLLQNREGEKDLPANPHIWLDPLRAIKQVENIRDGLISADPRHADGYKNNAAVYINKIRVLDTKIREAALKFKNKNFVAFHPAFDYFALRYGLNQAAVIEKFPGREPSAKYLVELVNLINTKNIQALFSEPQFSSQIVENMARDLNLPVYVLDPIVTGELRDDLYEIKMRENLKELKKALGEE